MKARVRKPDRKLRVEDAAKYLSTIGEDTAGGFTARILADDERIPDGSYETPESLRRTWGGDNAPLAIGVIGQPTECSIGREGPPALETVLIVRFNPTASYPRGDAGWRIRFTADIYVNDKLYEANHEIVDIIPRLRPGNVNGYYCAMTEKAAIARVTRDRKNFKLISIEPIEASTVNFSGTTRFQATEQGRTAWYSFDRLGVEDSFCGDDQRYSRASDLLASQLKRIEESRSRRARSEPIPGGFGWSLTPDRKAEVISILKKLGHYSFHPSGFGTGKRLIVPKGGSKRGRTYAKVAPQETAEYFGFPALLVEEFDCD